MRKYMSETKKSCNILTVCWAFQEYIFGQTHELATNFNYGLIIKPQNHFLKEVISAVMDLCQARKASVTGCS